jgi:hypothetical protein
MKTFSVAVCFAIIGCGNGGREAPTTGGDAPAATAPSASATTAEATAPSTNAEAAAPEAGGFRVIAEGDKLRIYPLGDGAVLDADAFIALVGDGPLVQDPEFTKTAGGDPRDILGHPVAELPATFSVAARLQHYRGRASGQLMGFTPMQAGDGVGELWSPDVFARVNGVWVKQELLRPQTEDREIKEITGWDDGRAIAVVGMNQDLRFSLVNSKPGVVVPAPGKPTAEQGEDCRVRMDPGWSVSVFGLPSGHLFAIGRECKTGKAIAERWEPKKVRGEATPIEIDDAQTDALVAASPDEAYALFTSARKQQRLATWDGKAWKVEDDPFGAGGLFVAGDGSVWGFGKKGLFHHPKGGAWTKVELPAGTPTSAWAKSDNDVWVVLDEKKLVRNGGPAAKAVKLPPASNVASVLARDKRWLATPFCKSVYAMLATIGPKGGKPPESHAGLTEAVHGAPELLKDVTFVVEDNGASLFVGAKAPSVEVGEKIIAAFKAKNPKTTPMLYCHEPKVVGTLKVD